MWEEPGYGLGDRDSIPGRDSCLRHRIKTGCWGPHSLLPNANWGLFPRG